MDTNTPRFEKILFETNERVAWLTLNRPSALNAMDEPMLLEIERAIGIANDADDIGAVVIIGAGRAFSAGGDLKAAAGLNPNPPAYLRFVRLWNRVFTAVEAAAKPTIAAIHGHCLAGGLELALCCDISIAAEDANIGDHHAKFNLLPGGGSSQRLPRLIGLQRAKDLLYTGRSLSGIEAERMGLVCRVVPTAELRAAAGKLAGELAAKPRDFLPMLKRVVDRGTECALPAGLELEMQAIYGSLLTPTRSQGFDAFGGRKS
jgi:enoyl-CoA hydratase/carnithine racemase